MRRKPARLFPWLFSLGLAVASSCNTPIGTDDGANDGTDDEGPGDEGGSGGADESGGKSGSSSGQAGRGGSGGKGGASGGAGGGAAGGGAGGSAGAATGGAGGAIGGAGGAGSGGAAGQPMAGAGGNPGTGGAVTSACGALLCDDFEQGTVGSPPGPPLWTSVRQEGTKITIDETRAKSGKRSVKITIPNTDGATGLFGTSNRMVFPASGHLYMRAMMWLDSTPSGNGHWAWMQTSGQLTMESGGKVDLAALGIGGHPAQLQSIFIGSSKDNPLAADCWKHTNRAVPTKTWACVEWHLDAVKNAQELWIDGQAISELTFTSSPPGGGCLGGVLGNQWLIPNLIAARFGWIHYHTLSANTLWVDDVAVDSKRIGCPK